jgi:hypothetical protein
MKVTFISTYFLISVDDLSTGDRMLVYSINPAMKHYDIYTCQGIGKMLIYLPSMEYLPTKFMEKGHHERSKIHK